MEKGTEVERWNWVGEKEEDWDLPGGPVIENLPSNAGDVRSIPCQGLNLLWRYMLWSTCIHSISVLRSNYTHMLKPPRPHTLSPCSTIREACELQQRNLYVSQPEKSPYTERKTQCSQKTPQPTSKQINKNEEKNCAVQP